MENHYLSCIDECYIRFVSLTVLALNSRKLACEENWDQGGFPVAISMMVHAKDQMSAILPCPVCLMTSGAIQYEVPFMLFAPDSAQC